MIEIRSAEAKLQISSWLFLSKQRQILLYFKYLFQIVPIALFNVCSVSYLPLVSNTFRQTHSSAENKVAYGPF